MLLHNSNLIAGLQPHCLTPVLMKDIENAKSTRKKKWPSTNIKSIVLEGAVIAKISCCQRHADCNLLSYYNFLKGSPRIQNMQEDSKFYKYDMYTEETDINLWMACWHWNPCISNLYNNIHQFQLFLEFFFSFCNMTRKPLYHSQHGKLTPRQTYLVHTKRNKKGKDSLRNSSSLKTSTQVKA